MSTVLIMAGGTGGHVFPALAVARKLRRRGAMVVWLGVRGGMEVRIARKEKIPIATLKISGMRGRGLLRGAAALLKLPLALARAFLIARRYRPDVFLGFGGFVSAPGAVAAFLLRKPLVIHESNAVAGITNRLLARIATRSLSAYPDALPNAEVVGNPVRDEIKKIPAPGNRLSKRRGALRVLIVGGSQGAAVFNHVLPQAMVRLRKLEPEVKVTLRHQCGAGNSKRVAAAYKKSSVAAQAVDFIDNIASAYAWSDIVVCRAGAMTLSELAAAGAGAVLVPFPFAAGQHQDANAAHSAKAGAALRLPQEQMKPMRVAALLSGFSGATGRKKILHMARCARALAVTNAATRTATLCMKLARGSANA